MKREKKCVEIVNANNFVWMESLSNASSQCAQILAAFAFCIALKEVSKNAKQFETINNNYDHA